MTREAIILAGGYGTRLQSVVSDVPKPMAPVQNKPFLAYILDFLAASGIEKIVLSVGHKHEAISAYFNDRYSSLSIRYAIETEPLGTGGGIKHAMPLTQADTIFIINGDTFFNVNLENLYRFHQQHRAQLTLALKPLQNFDRYGTVEIDTTFRITGFNEKQFKKSGLINGGIYCAERHIFDGMTQKSFSIEKDFFEKNYRHSEFFGFPCENYFIDIGIPDDYHKACNELPTILDR